MAVKRTSYFSIEAEDKPGALVDLLNVLRNNNVNLKALWGFGVGGGRARIFAVPQNADKFMKVATAAGYQPMEGTVFFMTGKDRVGALCKNLDQVKAANVNMHALNALALGGNFGAYIWPERDNVEALGKALGAK